MMHIFLTGFMGVGKTTIGKELSTELSLPYVDLDEYIEQEYGDTISTIFEKEGELYFRKLEKDCLSKILKSKKEQTVISLGGGTIASMYNWKLILGSGISVYLYKSWEDTKTGLSNMSDRPLIKQNSMDQLEMIFNQIHF